MRLRKLLEISMLKTVYFNLHYFGIKGMRLPVIVSKNVMLKNLRGGVKIESYKTGNIRIGFERTGICDPKYQRSIWYVDGIVSLGENVKIAAGTKISCAEGATLQIGKSSSINVNSQVICMEHIALGENVMLSWDDLVMDSDCHPIREGAVEKPVSKPIIIGNDVWVGCRTTILKGCTVPDGCIVAANSTVTRTYQEEHCLITTNGVVKHNVFWER